MPPYSKPYSKIEYEYDKAKNIVKINKIRTGNSSKLNFILEYDENDKLIKSSFCDSLHRDCDNSPDIWTIRTYSYNDQEDILLKLYYPSGHLADFDNFEYIYDNNLLIEKREFDSNNNTRTLDTYEYDKEGNIIKEKHINYKFEKETSFEWDNNYEYDEQGNLAKEVLLRKK